MAASETKPALGLATCTALVMGNMVGSGFFVAPSALAPYGTTALIGWAVMAVGAMCLGMVFARLARIAPATGGPYAYTRMGFGPFAGFLIAWGYWISIWASLPAIAAAFVGYLRVLIPALEGQRTLNIAIGLGAIWGVALVNLQGVKEAGLFQVATTYTKLVPFIAIAAFGLFWVDWQTFETINPSGQPFLSSLAATAPLTMFAFLGIESATVPAGDVIDPQRTIPRATLLGTAVSALIYLLGTAVVMGVVPRETLIHSAAPFADAARLMWGGWAATVIALAAVISSLGALNGWTLMLAQVPMREHSDKPLSQIRYAYVGDTRSNMGHSLMIVGCLMGMDVRLCGPKQLWPSDEYTNIARDLEQKYGAKLTITDDPQEAVRGVDFIHTDVWVSMGEPKEVWQERISLLRRYQVNAELMRASGSPQVKFMHCLPAFHDTETKVGKDIAEHYGIDNGLEVTNDVFESEANVAFDQAENRLHTIKAILVATLGD